MTRAAFRAKQQWLQLRRLSFVLLGLWFFVSVLTIWFARELANLRLFGWPLSFFMAAQGLMLFYLLLIGLYAWLAERFERQVERQPGNPHGQTDE